MNFRDLGNKWAVGVHHRVTIQASLSSLNVPQSRTSRISLNLSLTSSTINMGLFQILILLKRDSKVPLDQQQLKMERNLDRTAERTKVP